VSSVVSPHEEEKEIEDWPLIRNVVNKYYYAYQIHTQNDLCSFERGS